LGEWRAGRLGKSTMHVDEWTKVRWRTAMEVHFKLDALRNAQPMYADWRSTRGLSVVSQRSAALRRSRPTADAVTDSPEGRSRLRCRSDNQSDH